MPDKLNSSIAASNILNPSPRNKKVKALSSFPKKRVQFINGNLRFYLEYVKIVYQLKPYNEKVTARYRSQWKAALTQFNEYAIRRNCQPLDMQPFRNLLARVEQKFDEGSFPESNTRAGLSPNQFDEFVRITEGLVAEYKERKREIEEEERIKKFEKSQYKVKVVTPRPRQNPQTNSNNNNTHNNNNDAGSEIEIDDSDLESIEEAVGAHQHHQHQHHHHQQNGFSASSRNNEPDSDVGDFLKGLQDVLLNVEKQRIPNIINQAGGSGTTGAASTRDSKEIIEKVSHLQIDVDILKHSLSDISVKLNKIMDKLHVK